MAAAAHYIHIIKRPTVRQLVASFLSDELQKVTAPFGLEVREEDKQGDYPVAETERVHITSLSHDQTWYQVWFMGTVIKPKRPNLKYHCAGRVYTTKQGKYVGGFVNISALMQASGFSYGEALDSDMWRQELKDASDLTDLLLGQRWMGAEIIKHAMHSLNQRVRRLPDICPECGSELEIKAQIASAPRAICPNHGHLGTPGDRVIAIKSHSRAFPRS
jgi:hypothetical protein